ncbi:MAG TPA: patatin-like phospholipase family protein [Acidimicrobiia bacterium]|nr:patatin-like phospholipase family protein [Acidimicrobiia bacterium]
MARIGLVLGAGGVTGGAFEAGVLAALEEATGWDPRTADLVVGTSVGALTGALLRAGMSSDDLAARNEGRPLTIEGAALVHEAGMPPELAPLPPRPSRRRFGHPEAHRVLLDAVRRRSGVRPGVLAAALVTPGTVPASSVAREIGSCFDGTWPEARFWVCAARLDFGGLRVFGRTSEEDVTVRDAVAASCAVPGYLEPVELDGVNYVDGAVHSFTNLGEVAGDDLDLVIVIAPVSVANRRQYVRGAPTRLAGRAQLDREIRRVEQAGTRVVAFQPAAADQSAMGRDMMDHTRRGAVTRHARDSTLRMLEHDRLLELLHDLGPAR